jgi:hypothetical protein
MNLTPLFCVGKAMEQSLLLPSCGLQLAIFVISAIPAIPTISTIDCVDLPIILFLLWGPLAAWFKESSLGLKCLNAHVSNCEKISHCFGLLHGDFLSSLDVTNPIVKDIDDFDILDVRGSIPSIVKIFHIVPETFIMLLFDGL